MAQYDIADVNNQLQQEAGRIGEMIAAKLIATDPWNRLIKQDTFPAGMGESIQTLIQERTTVPNASSTAWEDVRLLILLAHSVLTTSNRLLSVRPVSA